MEKVIFRRKYLLSKYSSRNRFSQIFIFTPDFSLGNAAGVAALGDLDKLHGFQQSLIVLLALLRRWRNWGAAWA